MGLVNRTTRTYTTDVCAPYITRFFKGHERLVSLATGKRVQWMWGRWRRRREKRIRRRLKIKYLQERQIVINILGPRNETRSADEDLTVVTRLLSNGLVARVRLLSYHPRTFHRFRAIYYALCSYFYRSCVGGHSRLRNLAYPPDVRSADLSRSGFKEGPRVSTKWGPPA